MKDRVRLVIEEVTPEIDGGRFPIKRTVGEDVVVEADIFADGHDAISTFLLYRKEEDVRWTETPMDYMANDRWKASFRVTELGRHYYTIIAWVDAFKSWRCGLEKKTQAEQEVTVELLSGANLIEEASRRAHQDDVKRLEDWAAIIRDSSQPVASKVQTAMKQELAITMARYPDQRFATIYYRELEVVVDREKAVYGTWYEMFPRSCSSDPRRHGTFKDCENRLPYIAEMGFDVLYLPPIHPIGHTQRKGKNNALIANQDDPGTPWAIGSEEGGHKDIHPQLGTLNDFRSLVSKALSFDIEIALDIAFQCSPDHPYVKEHPEWFRTRPDGSIQYAENPPKKYHDIFPLDFDSESWHDLWQELKSIILFWVEQGVRIFRIDNPHTKPFAFWEWLITETKKEYPDLIFLSEAFTRPKIMYQLTKLGFTQSYTYFTWRNTKEEFADYFHELTQTKVKEYFRPNLFTNTPDILTEYLQNGGRPAFMIRLVLAATLGASYGIYGPAFELCENTAREKGSEEYLDSEKYEIKRWDIERADGLRSFITSINSIRRDNSALHTNRSLQFHNTDNSQLLCYSKSAEDLSNVILVVINLNHEFSQSGWTDLNLGVLGLQNDQPFTVHDLITDFDYHWCGARNYVELNPHACPTHIFRVEKAM
ncbi:MAG: alpha-1,4-glucan--maltose-1-phosphate maltosyltransferase [Chloroflexota bacterium]|nr:alpha-1,4-glucan--maltose-1-phosphate maltosyltransferase [Chloroflexota bacterium]